jgi:hypothetical protein
VIQHVERLEANTAWDRFAPIIQAELDELPLTRKAPRLLPTHEGDVAGCVALQRSFFNATPLAATRKG